MRADLACPHTVQVLAEEGPLTGSPKEPLASIEVLDLSEVLGVAARIHAMEVGLLVSDREDREEKATEAKNGGGKLHGVLYSRKA